jgi:hypothetical protein
MRVALPPLSHTSRLEKAYRGRGGIAPLNLNLGARWRGWDTVTPLLFSLGEKNLVSIEEKVGGGAEPV